MRKNRFVQFQTLLEIAMVFAVFYVFGAWPVPDSNEPYYIGKAIHYWQPDWIPDDPFLQTKDSHWAFYAVFGWLTFFLSPAGMAWTGRLATWALAAWSWQRLSRSLIPIRWTSIPTALALAYYVDSYQMAGEWILGGVEGKSIAFPFVFFGLEAMIRGRWHRVWIYLGIASAFHVLVGGWTVLAAAAVWLAIDARRTVLNIGRAKNVREFVAGAFPVGLICGGLISLFGLVPALMLDYGSPREIVAEAHQIYVFDRLYHHLVPYAFPWTHLTRFFLLTAVWVLICRFGHLGSRRHRRFDAFVWGTLFLTLIGLVAAYGLRDNRALSAEILRFYWFRLSDVAVPMGVALGTLQRLLVMFRRHRKSSGAGDATNAAWPFRALPTLSGWLALLGIPFAVYLLADYCFFSRRIYFVRVGPDLGIPWATTLLVCWAALRLMRFAPRNDPAVRTWRHWGFLMLYASILLYAPFDSMKSLADRRTHASYSRIEPGRPYAAYYWKAACDWIADPENTAPTARFYVPRECTTFKWHARRSDVGVWKEIPQDAEGIVAWYRTMHDLFFYRDEEGALRDDRSLTILLWWKTSEDIDLLRRRYGFDYILCAAYPDLSHHTNLELAYENEVYRLYRVFPLRTKSVPETPSPARSRSPAIP